MRVIKHFVLMILISTPYYRHALSQANSSTQDGFVNKIFGGDLVDISEVPYQALMKINGVDVCGGVILSDTWILTAAHCLFIPAPGMTATTQNTQIHVGLTDRLDLTTGQLVSIAQIISHPNFDPSTFENDIALIQLSTPLVFNESVMPIEYANNCNTSELDYFEGRNVIISGWGSTDDTPNGTSQLLNAVTIPIITRQTAMTLNLSTTSSTCPVNVSNNMLAFFSLGTAAGKGDSGGPAVMSKNGNDINIGVTSWGCPPKNELPTIYTNVRNYASWIEQSSGLVISKPGVDLYTRDRPWDLGKEPSNVDFCWISDDIWVRNQNDGQTNSTHQNPIFHNTNPNYINIRIRNRGCLPSSGNDLLKVYWAKASTALAWPNQWNGSLNVNGQSLGNSIGDVLIPVVQPGGSVVVSIPWFPPNPLNYVGLSSDPLVFNEEPHHFCILSRIESSNDPMTVLEGGNMGDNVLKNNNISLKNVSVFNLYPLSDKETKFSSTIFVGNPEEMAHPYRFDIRGCQKAAHYKLDSIAELIITMDSLIWHRWIEGGMQSSGDISVFNAKDYQLRVKLNSQFGNILLQPNEYRPLKLSVHFLIRHEINDVQGKINIVQINETDNKILGGEQFDIQRYIRTPFFADAGGDKEIVFSDSLYLIAQDIVEDAIFNWYNSSSELVFSGKEFKLLPMNPETYKLEVISLEDGAKDYDSVSITLRNSEILSIIPNPAVDNVHISYVLPQNRQVFLYLTNLQDGSMHFVEISSSDCINLDLSNYTSGFYSVAIVVDGQVQDSKNMIIQNQ